MPVLLFINTSGSKMIIAISENNKILAEKIHEEAREQAAFINVFIQDLLKENNLDMNDLDGIVICGGPGSYTGLRVGMSTAKGIAYALDKKIMIFDRLSLIAFSFNERDYEGFHKLVFLKAREREYYYGYFSANNEFQAELKHIYETDLEKILENVSPQTYYITDDEHLNLNFDKFEIDEDFQIDLKAWLK